MDKNEENKQENKSNCHWVQNNFQQNNVFKKQFLISKTYRNILVIITNRELIRE